MPSSIHVPNIPDALSRRLYSTVVAQNRLEGRPRTQSFERALQAEVRDALWMLTKQWQMGEFSGSDAGSPVFAKLQIDTTRLTKYRPNEHPVELFEYEVPLEAKVERRPVPLVSAGKAVALDLRLLMGRQWLALIAGIGNYKQLFIDAYPINAPDPTSQNDVDRCAHPEVWQTFMAVAGRAMDGAALYTHLTANPANHAYDGVAIAQADQAALDGCATRFIAWFERQFFQPSQNSDDAWVPDRLEYKFAASAPMQGGEKVYLADEYYQGRLDWYSFDVDSASQGLDPAAGSDITALPPDAPKTMLPTAVSFAGMPNTRWWTFEDHKTNFGDIDASTTDVAKLLFIEFALVYANDWFLIPYTLPAGAIASIRGFVVTNVFGERLWVDAADRGPDADWQRWSIFTIDQHDPTRAADTSLLILPTLPKIQESPPTEEILLIRDEIANMVWGVEKIVPLASGESKPGPEVARETLAFLQRQITALLAGIVPVETIYKAPIRYQIMSTVPENWIPFIPVHVDGDNREIQLQRAALPRILEGDPNPPAKVQPVTMLLREGLDSDPMHTYYIHEEEVPRAGVRLTQSYQRARWYNGRVFTWLRVRKQTGRGEGASRLEFDQILNVPKST